MILRRRTVLKWGFRLGVVAAYLTDTQHGSQRRDDLLESARQIVGESQAKALVDWLDAMNQTDLTFPASLLAARTAANRADDQTDETTATDESAETPKVQAAS